MYIVLEFQTSEEGDVSIVPPASYSTEEEALSVFYSKCSFAVASSVAYHTVMIVYQNGNVLDSKCFDHVRR